MSMTQKTDAQLASDVTDELVGDPADRAQLHEDYASTRGHVEACRLC
jgi:hypothetical protein